MPVPETLSFEPELLSVEPDPELVRLDESEVPEWLESLEPELPLSEEELPEEESLELELPLSEEELPEEESLELELPLSEEELPEEESLELELPLSELPESARTGAARAASTSPTMRNVNSFFITSPTGCPVMGTGWQNTFLSKQGRISIVSV